MFIDLTKTFDTVDQVILLTILKFGVPPKFLNILNQFHNGMLACVLVDEQQFPAFPVNECEARMCAGSSDF